MKFNIRFLTGGATIALALAAAVVAVSQPAGYTVGKNDSVKISIGAASGGGYRNANFFSAVATAVLGQTSTSPCAATAPATSTGFGTNAAVVKSTANCTMSITSGSTAASNGVVAMPQAADGWACTPQDVTTNTNAMFITKETAETVNTVTIDSYQSNGAVGNWVANDTIVMTCDPF